MTSRPWIFLLALAVVTVVSAHGDTNQQFTPYVRGDWVKVECPAIDHEGNITTNWEPGPICMETGEPLAFPFAVDAMVKCTLGLDTAMYRFMQSVITAHAGWKCRMRLTNDQETYFVPLHFNVWGLVEETHLHLMNHFNFVFHVLDGFFLGAAAYSLRDHFVPLQADSQITIHGPVRWFVGMDFDMIADPEDSPEFAAQKILMAIAAQQSAQAAQIDGSAPAASPEQQTIRPIRKDEIPTVSMLMRSVKPAVLISYCILSATASAGVCILIYLGVLKPKLIKEYRKQK